MTEPSSGIPRIRLVGVSGSLSAPSRTTTLVRQVSDQFGEALEASVEIVELAKLADDLAARQRADVSRAAESALQAVERADVLVVGSPAYRAAYTGIFKHFFDFVGQYALAEKPVVLTATGGSDRHALLVEHQMRPLFGFFQALTLPVGIFATESDFVGDTLSSEVNDRIDLALQRSLGLLTLQLSQSGRWDVGVPERSPYAANF